MSEALNIFAPLLILVLGLFLVFRLKFFSTQDIGGKHLFLWGTILCFVSVGWNWLRIIDSYSAWFVLSVYPVIDMVQMIIAGIGLLLIVAGLSMYADFWQTRREAIEQREGKLSVLGNLQYDAGQPYHLTELLNIAVREMLFHSGSDASALFLVNLRQRQLILTSSAGFSKQETVSLEYFPLGRNVVSQAIDLAEPLIAGDFEIVDREGKRIDSSYRSTLVLPLVSGMDKLGALVLLSTEEKFFDRTTVSYLAPIAQWLAEKIRSARLTRELTSAKKQLEQHRTRSADFETRLASAAVAMGGPDSVAAFCRALTGLAESGSVHLYGIKHGSLVIYGGSEPLFDLQENYKAALVDTLDKQKCLIVNQEASSPEGQRSIILSSLICPLGGTVNKEALLFRREQGLFKVDDETMRFVELAGRLATLMLGRNISDRMALTRRHGFDKILQLLRMDRSLEGQSGADFLVDEISKIIPSGSLAISFDSGADGSFGFGRSHGLLGSIESGESISGAEGLLSRVTVSNQPEFVYGRPQVRSVLEEYDNIDREKLVGLFGERDLPLLLAAAPFGLAGQPSSVALVALWDVEEGESDEWIRLLTLASGLVSLRIAISRAGQVSPPGETLAQGEIVNQLNNSLSVILGKAELALTEHSLTPRTRELFQTIIDSADRAGEEVSRLGQPLIRSEESSDPVEAEPDFDQVLRKRLAGMRISGSLHMVNGRPREIDLKLGSPSVPVLDREDIEELFEGALSRFTAAAADEDIITVSTYPKDDRVYLDISRHRKNFPPVKPIAGFSSYISAEEALKARPGDLYLNHLTDGRGQYAIDTISSSPAYLSFRFPIKGTKQGGAERVDEEDFKILAIDDEAVILDLISAMCQSLGYAIATAGSGEEGLALVAEERFDLVLTDLAMPGISGLDVAREIHLNHPQTPVILVTGWEAELNSAPIKEAGVTEILFKPFRIEQLTEVIQAAASRR